MTTTSARAKVDIETILFATDFSPASDLAVSYVFDIARLYEADVILAHAVPPVPFDLPMGFPVLPEQLEQSARLKMRKLEKRMGKVPHRVEIHEGDPWSLLSKIIQERRVDLLVMGTHGRKGAQKLVMGSVAEEVLHRVECPVLTVGPGDRLSSNVPCQWSESCFSRLRNSQYFVCDRFHS